MQRVFDQLKIGSIKTSSVLIFGLIILAPILFAVIGSEWLYPNPEISDSFLNYAYSYSYDDTFYRKDAYKFSRVPWIIPLFYIQKLVGPFLVSPFLNVFGWILLSISFYILIKQLFGSRRSLLSLPWVIFYPHLVGIYTGGGTYHGILANLYFIVGLIAWTKPGRKLWGLIAGLFFASAIHCSPVYLNLMLFLPFLDLFKNKKIQFKLYFMALFGGVLITLIWGAFHALLNETHSMFFFKAQWYQFLALFNSDIHSVHSKTGLFSLIFNTFKISPYRTGLYVAPLTAGAFFSLIQLVLFSKKKKSVGHPALNLAFFVFVSLWFLWQILEAPSLEIPDFTYPLQIVIFIVFASWLSEKPLNNNDYWTALQCYCFLFLITVFAPFTQTHIDVYSPYLGLGVTSFLLIGLVYIFTLPWRKTESEVLGVVLLGISYLFMTVDSKNDFFEDCHTRKKFHHALLNTVSSLREKTGPHYAYFIYNKTNERIYRNSRYCAYESSYAIDKLGQYTSYIFGYQFTFNHENGNNEKYIESLTAKDFEYKDDPRILIVLYPMGSASFLDKFIQKARTLGYEPIPDHMHSEDMDGFEITYYAFKLKKKINNEKVEKS